MPTSAAVAHEDWRRSSPRAIPATGSTSSSRTSARRDAESRAWLIQPDGGLAGAEERGQRPANADQRRASPHAYKSRWSGPRRMLIKSRFGGPRRMRRGRQSRMRDCPERCMHRSVERPHAAVRGAAHVRPRQAAHAPPGTAPIPARSLNPLLCPPDMTLPNAPTYDLVLLLDARVEEGVRTKILDDTRAAIAAAGEVVHE